MTTIRTTEWRDLTAGSLVWFLAAAGLFGAATAGGPRQRAWTSAANLNATGNVRRWLVTAALCLASATMLAYAAKSLPQPVLVAGWLLAQAIWVVAFVPGWRPHLRPSRRAMAEASAVAILLLVAAIVRLLDNFSLPLLFHGDSASFGLQARDLLAGRYDDFFGAGWAGIPYVAFWTSAISLLVFGDSLGGLNTVPTLEGLACLPALYLLTRQLFNRRVAVLATALATGDILLIHYSRVAQYIDPVPFVAWSLFLLVRGLRQGGTWPFAIAGLLAGYAMNSYYSGRLILPLAVAALTLTALAAPRPLWVPRGGVAALIGGVVVSMGPTLVFDARHADVWLGRTQEVLVTAPGVWFHTAQKYSLQPTDILAVLFEQVKHSSLSFWHCCDTATQFGMARTILDPISGTLLILGLSYAGWHLGNPRLLLILAWLVSYLAAGALTVDPYASPRMLGAALPVATLGGLALDRALALFPSGRGWSVLALSLGVLVTAASGFRNWQDYLAWGTDPHFASPPMQAGRFLMVQAPAYQVRLVTNDFDWSLRELRFLLGSRSGASVDPGAVARGRIDWPNGPTIFVLRPKTEPIVQRLERKYPAGRLVDGSFAPLTGVFYAFFTE